MRRRSQLLTAVAAPPPAPDYVPLQPFVREPKIGRNEPLPVRKRQEMQEVLREMINVVGSLICCQHRMSNWAREVGCVIRDSRPGP